MKSLQEKLLSPPVLKLQYAEGQMTLGTDVCDVQIEIVLSQEQLDKIAKPMRNWLRSLTSAKRVYDTTPE